MRLVTVSEHARGYCCSNCSSVLFWFSLYSLWSVSSFAGLFLSSDLKYLQPYHWDHLLILFRFTWNKEALNTYEDILHLWLECFFSLSFLQARPCMYLHYLDWSQTIFTCRINLRILWSFIESAKVHQKILHLIDHSYRCPKWNFEAILVVTWCQKVLLTFLPATVSPVTSGISF